METVNDVPLLLRREIEARITAPLIQAFEKEIGVEKTREIVRGVVAQAARKSGEGMRDAAGGDTLAHLKVGMEAFRAGDALDMDYSEASDTRLCLEVSRCKYAEMYRSLGLEEYGALLSCERDGFLFEGFNPEIKFTRTHTIMSGGDGCDFCMELKDKK